MKPKPGCSSRSWDKDRDRSRYTTTRGGGSSTSKKRDGESSRTVQPKRKKRKTTKYTKYDRSDNKEDKKLHRGEHLSSDLDRADDLENSPPCFKRSWVLGLFSLLSISMISKAGLSLSDAYTATFAPIAGRISKCISNWKIVSTGQWILNVVKHGYKLQFSGALPPTPHRVSNLPTDGPAAAILDFEVEQMLAKSAIQQVQSSDDELISCFFARPKKTPGKWRPIVSLKFLNKFLRYIKFRMTTIKDVRLWLRKGYYLASIDLTDAYFSVPIHESAWKYVRFVWRNITYEFKCIMFGLGASPRVFTKVLKVVVKYIRLTFNILIVAYLDDFLIQAKDYDTCRLHIELAILTFQSLGFDVNYSKSCMVPATTIEHLGFVWNSLTMEISLPTKKVEKIVSMATNFLANNGCTANELRSFLGTLESVRPVVEVASLHYRHLQYVLRPLRKGPWRGRKFLPLNQETRQELLWWKEVFPTPPYLTAPMTRGQCTVVLKADASGNFGWGGHSSRGQFCQGQWKGRDRTAHINKKEIMAGHRTVQHLMRQGDYVQLGLDNMTAVSFINRMGGTRSKPLCLAAMYLWETVLSRGGWLKAVWVPREENQLSDLLSKSALQTWDFSLDKDVAAGLWTRWFLPTVDTFASKACHLLPQYYSWHPDQNSQTRDALSVRCWPDRVYCFPPVPMISLVLQKIQSDRVTAIIIVPGWKSALWWDMLNKMLLEEPVHLPYYTSILSYSNPLTQQRLPYLHPLVACLVSGAVNSLS